LISHKEPRIRKEVLSFLETIPDPKAKTYIMKFLNDENSAIRIRAMQTLAAARFAPALKMVSALTSTKDFEERDSAEKRAVYETLGELGSDQMVPLFREMLLKKFWFNKAKEKESVFYAIAGLRKIRTEAALQLMEEASAGKSDEAKAMITQAIKAIAAELAKSSTAP
jgi:HEAT repeat protein